MSAPVPVPGAAAAISVCVVVPVYNHAATVGAVVAAVRRHVDVVIVVDDGSTDASGEAARRAGIPDVGGRVEVMTLEANEGKGVALDTGLRRAVALGFTHAVTLDADGQHRASDVPALVAAASVTPNAIVIGARDLTAPQIPRGSRVGRAISNYWVLRTTGHDLSDTQSGCRVLPAAQVLSLPLRCRRYDYEVEVLVRGAWAGLELRCVPIDVVYPARDERVSHFAPWADNVRISWTYTRLAFRRLLPTRDTWRSLRTGVSEVRRHRLRDAFSAARALAKSGTRPSELALAVGTGALVGASPLWGLHAALTLYICLRLHLNAVAGFLGSNVSVPFIAPYLVFASVQCGHLVLHGEFLEISPDRKLLDRIPEAVVAYVVGSVPVAVAVAALCSAATYAVARSMRRGGS